MHVRHAGMVLLVAGIAGVGTFAARAVRRASAAAGASPRTAVGRAPVSPRASAARAGAAAAISVDTHLAAGTSGERGGPAARTLAEPARAGGPRRPGSGGGRPPE